MREAIVHSEKPCRFVWHSFIDLHKKDGCIYSECMKCKSRRALFENEDYLRFAWLLGKVNIVKARTIRKGE